MDSVFRALANPDRRRIMDLLKAKPGMNINELSGEFDFTRFALRKHLQIMREAGLVITRRSGNSKLLYLNVIPIQTVYERWMSKYSAFWAPKLTQLKHLLEEKGGAIAMPEKREHHLFQIYIRTSVKRLWQALTQPQQTRKYFYGTSIRSEFEAGSALEYFRIDEAGNETSVVVGEVVEVVPEKLLVHTFAFTDRDDPPSRVTYQIEEMGEMVKLTVIHDELVKATRTYEDTSEGWPYIISGLKSMLETGEALPSQRG